MLAAGEVIGGIRPRVLGTRAIASARALAKGVMVLRVRVMTTLHFAAID
jgi:predicted RecB family endonuclease